MAQHARLRIRAGDEVYFCDPHSPWQRGTNENTNGLLRRHFPNRTVNMHSANEIAAVAAALNSRGPERRLIGRHPQRRLTGFSYQPTKIVLRRPLESALYSPILLMLSQAFSRLWTPIGRAVGWTRTSAVAEAVSRVTEARRHAARPPSRERRSMPRGRATSAKATAERLCL